MQLDLLLSVLCTGFEKEDEDLFQDQCSLVPMLHFHIKQINHHHGPTFTNHKNLLLSTLVSTQEWGSEWLHFVPKRACCCPQRLLATTDSETACVCAGPSYPPKLCLRAAPRALLENLQFLIWNSLREWLSDNLHGLTFGLKLELCSQTNHFNYFISL